MLRGGVTAFLDGASPEDGAEVDVVPVEHDRTDALPIYTSLARRAKLSEFTVSEECILAGPQVTSIRVFELPPSESCSKYVSFESR